MTPEQKAELRRQWEDLIDAVDAISEYADNLAARVVYLSNRDEMTLMVLAEIDHMIVRMNGQSSQYRDELREIAERNGFSMKDSLLNTPIDER